jgi:hypothetical protein
MVEEARASVRRISLSPSHSTVQNSKRAAEGREALAF